MIIKQMSRKYRNVKFFIATEISSFQYYIDITMSIIIYKLQKFFNSSGKNQRISAFLQYDTSDLSFI